MSSGRSGHVAPSLLALDSDWFSEALRAGGYTQAAVMAVVAEPLAISGAVADICRLSLSYDRSGNPGPQSLIAKIRGTGPVSVGMDSALGLYAREARFYSDLANQVPVTVPRCYFVGDGDRTPMLLEDLGALRIGDQMEGLSVEDAERLMDSLGDLHAAFWDSPLLKSDWLASPAEGAYAEMVAQMVASGVAELRRRFSGRVDEHILVSVEKLAPQWRSVLTNCANGPQTLVHNDCRLDNMFFGLDGMPIFIDWQAVARTRGTQDVGNLLAGSMNISTLRENWESLLRRYHIRLCNKGVANYTWAHCVEHYRQNILYPLGAGIALLGHLDIGDGRGLGDAIVLRALQHCADLGAFSIL